MRKLIRGGRVLDPASGLDDLQDVLIEGNRISAIGPGESMESKLDSSVQIIEAQGMWVLPGLIDLHTHLREPGEEYKETIFTGSQAAAAGGFTSICCMPNTKQVNDNSAVTDLILRRAAEADLVRVFPVGAISQGLKGEVLAEYAELKEAGAVAVSDDGQAVMNGLLMRRALEYAKVFDLPVISHAEDRHLAADGVMNEGAVSARLGLKEIPSAAEDIMVFRDCSLAALTDGRLHIAHVSTEGAVELIRQFKARGARVSAEATPHHFTLTDEALESFDTSLKVNPPLRSAADVRAIQNGLTDGTIDAIATDHAPHSSIEKDVEFDYAAFGMVGLETAVPLTLRLVEQGILTPLQAVSKLTSEPARIIGLDLGRLSPRLPADVTIIDPGRKVTIDVKLFRSKSRNSPFHGWEVQGKTVTVLRDGKVIFKDQ
ncbi:MAG: dihydroorotase [Deltaproteobacteria bacterium]|nr:MAG: dihydroorotase [Deltaproteobacteria bacterium]